MKHLLFISLILFPFICHADVYMQTDANGNTAYSDIPLDKNAKKIETQTGNTTSEKAPANPASQHIAGNEKTRIPYRIFTISSPKDQETIQNQPTIVVDIQVDPSLQEGDQVQIYLDGHPWGNAQSSTHFELTRPDRGTHQIAAKLLSHDGSILKETPSNTIYIHQAHLGTAPRL